METRELKPADTNTSEAEQKESVDVIEAASAPAKKSFAVIFLFLLLLIITAAGTAGLYYLWQQQQALQNQQQNLADDLSAQIEQSSQKIQQGLTQQLQAQSNRIQQLQNELTTLKDLSQSALQEAKRGQRGWILAEVDYLLRLANRRLQVARDINGAIAALSSASERLYDLGDLRLFDVRKQLAGEVAQLKSIKQVDVSGIAMSLDQMSLYVNELPFKTVQEEVKAQVKDDKQTPVVVTGDDFADSLISTIISIGDIKVHQRSIKPASSASQQQQYEALLRTHLLSARLAVLRYDQKQFGYDIKQASTILAQHYQQQDNRVTNMQKDLTAFAAVNLTPQLPDITGSWQLLKKLLLDEEANKATEDKK